MHHAADIYGSMLVVHGGFSSENKETLSDIAIYDISNFLLLIFREKNVGKS